MKPPRPPKRSVSPFGVFTEETSPIQPFRDAFAHCFPALENPDFNGRLRSPADLPFVPDVLEKIWEAPANDAPELDGLCNFLVQHRSHFDEKKIQPLVFETMENLFKLKTDLFLIDHQDEEHCKKLGLTVAHRDLTLFSKERDTIIGRYFAPVTEREPGLFSHVVSAWVESENPDRLLHFLDFCAGSSNPTFEYYLVFTHPALHRLVTNKALLRGLFDKTKSVLSKISSPTWEKDVRHALNLV